GAEMCIRERLLSGDELDIRFNGETLSTRVL
ncbi:hypothetical protein, partial [Salmonella enterica]